MEYVCCKVFQMLSFIIILEKDFRLNMCVEALYRAFVRLILKYGCVFWDPYTAKI